MFGKFFSKKASEVQAEPQEVTVLKEIGQQLGLNLKDYGIAA